MRYMTVTRPVDELSGRIVAPASKYHAHRALILASLAEGTTTIDGRTQALHVRSTVSALRALGSTVTSLPGGYRVVGGPYRPKSGRISSGSSGSTLQFLLGLTCRSVGPAVTVDGQPMLRRRPIGPLLQGLADLGVELEATGEGLPVTVHPGRPTGGYVRLPGTLSQWISGLLLLGPLGSGDSTIEVVPPINERPYLELTLRMMRRFSIEVEAAADLSAFTVRAGQRYLPADVALPADMSSAAFVLAAAACLPGSITVANVDPQPDHPEAEILRVLRDMGAAMAFSPNQRELRIGNHGVRLSGIRYDCSDTPDLLPVLTVLGAVARGRTVLEHVGHARLKESDRVGAMLQLRRMGARIELEGDRLVIDGVERLRAAELSSFDDHRVLMALTVAGSLAEGGPTRISHGQAYQISYPEFLEHAEAIGLRTMLAGPGARPSLRTGKGLYVAQPENWHRRFAATGMFPGRLITDYLADDAAWTPDQAAVVDTSRNRERTITYGEMPALVDRAAAGLIDLGVRPGDIVAFQLPNWWEFAVLQLALVRIGAVSCPLMPILRQRELTFALGRTGARVLFVPETFRGVNYPGLIAEIRPDLPQLEHVVAVGDYGPADAGALGGLLRREPRSGELAARRPSAEAITQLLYTSGTSGEPKGILHTHNSLLASLVTHQRHLHLTDRDNVWIPSPCGHQTGFLYGLWLSVFLGSTGIYQDIWNGERGAEICDRHDARFVQSSTPFLSDLVDACLRRGSPLHSLRLFVCAGAPIPRRMAAESARVLGVTVMGGWGSTESGLVTAGRPEDPAERLWETDGRVLPGTGVRIVDAEGRDVPKGNEGELITWTPGMFVGYFGRPDAYVSAFRDDGWLRTGDLARQDAEGWVCLTGRLKDVIIRGGEKVPVTEVEEVILAHPAVAAVAVVAMPDARLGERACAYVVLHPGARLNLPTLQVHLAGAGMAKTYWPERLEIVASMPRTPSGKIQKYLLRQRLLPASEGRAGN